MDLLTHTLSFSADPSIRTLRSLSFLSEVDSEPVRLKEFVWETWNVNVPLPCAQKKMPEALFIGAWNITVADSGILQVGSLKHFDTQSLKIRRSCRGTGPVHVCIPTSWHNDKVILQNQ